MEGTKLGKRYGVWGIYCSVMNSNCCGSINIMNDSSISRRYILILIRLRGLMIVGLNGIWCSGKIWDV